LFAAFLFASLAFAFRQGPLQALATELVPAHSRGTFVAMRNTASQVGIAIAAAVSGVLYDSYGYGAVGAFSAIMTSAAAICIFLMKEPSRDEQS
jgi:predicted MFS family arabinose efflux permease